MSEALTFAAGLVIGANAVSLFLAFRVVVGSTSKPKGRADA